MTELPAVRVEDASLEVLAAWVRDHDEFASADRLADSRRLAGVRAGDVVRRRASSSGTPRSEGWWTQLFFDEPTGHLVGSGGYKGPPVQREVEIGYEIAPGYRRQGYATAATLVMTRARVRDRARGCGDRAHPRRGERVDEGAALIRLRVRRRGAGPRRRTRVALGVRLSRNLTPDSSATTPAAAAAPRCCRPGR